MRGCFMKSICLVIPWFGGNFKNYFQFFLESCRKNPTINWLIYTDNDKEWFFPSNVLVKKTSFEKISAHIQLFYDFKISLENPYKLCDFKPAYGEIFKNDLKEYDFWGYCDCDVIFGNIRSFLTDDILNRYEKVFTRGHLCIYRNEPQTNAFYRTQKKIDYRSVFSSPKSFAFDEWSGVSKAWFQEGRACYDELLMDDVLVGYDGFRLTKELSGVISPYHGQVDESKKYREMRNIFYSYENGKLKRKWLEKDRLCETEIIYVHFQKRMMEVNEGVFDYNNYSIADNHFLPFLINSNKDVLFYVKREKSLRNSINRIRDFLYPFYVRYIKSFFRKK